MDRLASILAIVLFAVGTVVHAANATSMSLTMSPAAMAYGDMGDCDACPPDNGKASLCGLTCLAPFVGIVAGAGIELPIVSGGIVSSPLKAPDGYVGSPDPSPPRTIILN